MRQASEGLCGVQAELVPGYVCSGAWFWCNKLQCAGIISPYFRPDFTSVTERGHRAKERVWWLHVRVKRSRDQHPTSCVCVCLSVCGREGERACTWVCCFAYLAEDIFFSLRWTEPVKKKKKTVSHLPSPWSSLHNPFIFWPLCNRVSKCTLILQPISYCISAKASIFPSLLPTHLSILLDFKR